MYYREYLSKTKGDDLSTLKESLATELMMSKKKFFLPCSHVHGDHLQTLDEFQKFCTDLNLLLPNVTTQNSSLSVKTDDFDAKFWKQCLEKENVEGREIYSLTPVCLWVQLVN